MSTAQLNKGLVKACDEYVSPHCSPDHPRGGVSHRGVFWFDEFLVVVDAAIDFIVLFALQLLLKEENGSFSK